MQVPPFPIGRRLGPGSRVAVLLVLALLLVVSPAWAAITRTSRITGEQGGFVASSMTSSSFTPGANTVLVATVASEKGTSDFAGPPSISGHSLTWTLITTEGYVVGGVEFGRVWMWWALVGGSPGSGTVTIDFGAVSVTRIALDIEEFDGADPTTPIAQTKTGTSSGTANFTLTLDSGPASTSVLLGVARTNLAGGSPVNPEAGWTEICDTINGTAQVRMSLVYRGDAVDSSHTWSSSGSPEWAGILLEIAAGVPLPPLQLRGGSSLFSTSSGGALRTKP